MHVSTMDGREGEGRGSTVVDTREGEEGGRGEIIWWSWRDLVNGSQHIIQTPGGFWGVKTLTLTI